MDIQPLLDRISALGLEETVELRPRRLSEAEMANLFQAADCFVFPYRQIDASGVYFLTKALGKWLIASQVGIFAEEVREGEQGTLVPPEDAAALASALAFAVMERPRPRTTAPSVGWHDIRRASRELYEQVAA